MNMPTKNSLKKQLSNRLLQKSFFTLFELIAIIIIITILVASFASSDRSATDAHAELSLTSEVDILKSNIRYVHALAMQDETYNWGLSFTATSYEIYTDSPDVIIPQLPFENSSTHQSTNVTFSPMTITFDKWGTVVSASNEILISNTAGTRHFLINRDTGFLKQLSPGGAE